MKIVALAGGVGGAKLAEGLYRALAPDELSVLGNTADDFKLWGLHISPDLDTVMYTLAGLANPTTGWGIAGDTAVTLGALQRLGVDPWFRLGDQDLATHIRRTELLAEGATLTEVTAQFMQALGVRAHLLPMTDSFVQTFVHTPAGRLAFQDYFVRRQHRDDVHGVEFVGVDQSRPNAAVEAAIAAAQLIVFCPSNPLVSIGPILAVPGLRDLLAAAPCPRIAVSPLVGGLALKGPADKMLADLGFEATAAGVARFYAGLIDGIVVDVVDAPLQPTIEAEGTSVLVADTVMRNTADRVRLAAEVLAWGRQLARPTSGVRS